MASRIKIITAAAAITLTTLTTAGGNATASLLCDSPSSSDLEFSDSEQVSLLSYLKDSQHRANSSGAEPFFRRIRKPSVGLNVTTSDVVNAFSETSFGTINTLIQREVLEEQTEQQRSYNSSRQGAASSLNTGIESDYHCRDSKCTYELGGNAYRQCMLIPLCSAQP